MATPIKLQLNGNTFNSPSSFVRALLNTDSISFPKENILHRYRTFNYNVTLAIVSKEEYNSQSYKQRGFDYIVFQSSGKPERAQKGATGTKEKDGKVTLTGNQVALNSFVNSGEGQYDFYLDELYIKSAFGNQQDWATQIKLKIIEPYSIDNFMKTCLTGLRSKGFYNLEKGTPFIIKVEFVGYRDANDQNPEVIPYATRYYPILITSIKANLTTIGTSYEITAAPMNEGPTYDDVNKLPERFTLEGITVADVMKSFEEQLNSWAIEAEKKQKYYMNRYKIEFATYSDDGQLIRGPNVISESPMYDQFSDAGNRSFDPADSDQYLNNNPKARKTTSDKKLLFQVKGRDGLIKVIDNLICDSHFLVNQIKQKFTKLDSKGNFDFYRIIPEVKLDRYDPAAAKMSQTITFIIVAIKIHKSKLPMNVNATNTTDLEQSLARIYEWQYTGNNRDILNFNLDFNMFWTKLIDLNYGQSGTLTGSNAPSIQTTPLSMQAPEATPDSENKSKASVQSPVTINPNSSDSKQAGGNARTTAETDAAFKLARAIRGAVNNPYEKVMFDMDILGDPMWLGCQFIDQNLKLGNSGDSNLYTSDGGFALRTVEPRVKVLAYAPIDFNSEGLLVSDNQAGANVSYGFQSLQPTGSQPAGLSTWSAYYQVTGVESFFTGGVFKQKLKGYRIYTDDKVNPTGNPKE